MGPGFHLSKQLKIVPFPVLAGMILILINNLIILYNNMAN
jgi:hypothetical protein